MGDQIVDYDGIGNYHISVATLNDIVARENVEYLSSLQGIEGIATKLSTSTKNGLSQDEQFDGFSQRIAAYVNQPQLYSKNDGKK